MVTRAALAAAFVLALAGCGSDALPRPEADRSGRLLLRTSGAAALEPLPGGGLRVGELSGRIRDVSGAGGVRPFTRLAVSRGGQRGLLGIAVDRRGRTFAAYTQARGGRIVVAAVGRTSRRLVWRGPPSKDLANGGHLDIGPDGRITIGIGDLQDPPATADPGTLNGKLLSLDPDGPPGQRPRVLSGGWNNPYAFTWNRLGQLWVADNAFGRRPERVGRGDPAGRGTPVLDLPRTRTTAPSGLTALGGGALAMCGYVSRRLERIVVSGGPPRADARPLATDCSLGVAQLTDKRIAYATGRAILVLDR